MRNYLIKKNRILAEWDEADKKAGKLIILFLGMSMIYVYSGHPYPYVTDETLYLRLAHDLYYREFPIFSLQYPLLYPLLLMPSFLFKTNFYEIMLFLNIIFKVIALCIIYRLFRKVICDESALLGLLSIAISPLFFLYSRTLMAENVACPLLIITTLFHYVNRNSDIGRGKKTVIGALLAFSCYRTKYLMILVLPIFCIYWCWKGRKNLKGFFKEAFFYTAVVVSVLFVQILFYSISIKTSLSIEIIKEYIGLEVEGIAGGYFPSYKWIICYTLYAALCSIFIIPGFILYAKKGRLSKNAVGLIVLVVSISGVLIYTAARHSAFVPYNEGGLMLKLLGRYVAYIHLLMIVVYFVIYDKIWIKSEVSRVRCYISFLISAGILIAAYCILYKRIFWNPSEDWLNGIRGAENSGFLIWGAAYVIVYLVGLAVISFSLKHRYIIISVSGMIVFLNSFTWLSTQDMEYNNSICILEEFLTSVEGQEGIKFFGNDNVSWNNLFSCGAFFTYKKEWDSEAVIRKRLYRDFECHPFDWKEENYMALSSAGIDVERWEMSDCVYWGDISADSSQIVICKIEDDMFNKVQELQPEILYLENGVLELQVNGSKNMFLICDNIVYSGVYEDALMRFQLNSDTVGDIYIYDLCKLYKYSIDNQWGL